MNGDSSIDPNLRDAVQSTQPPQEYPSPTDTTSNAARPPPPPNPQSPYQQHPQPFAPYPEDGAYHHTYYGPPPGHQYGPVQPSNGFPAPPPPRPPPPGPHYVSTRGGENAKRLRACEACRGLKVRCEPDPHGGACKRCLKAGRACEITPPSRKRQKKTDSRVSELEKQLADIQYQLKMRGRAGGSDSGGGEQDGDEEVSPFGTPQRPFTGQTPYPRPQDGSGSHASSPYVDSHAAGHKRLHSETMPNRPVEEAPMPLHPGMSHPRAVPEANLLASVRGIASSMDDQLGRDLLSQYLKTVLPPTSRPDAVVSTKFDLLRRSKPVLFVAIMMIMLQAQCKDGAATAARELNKDAAGKNDQALHVLSEVAMGDRGKGGGEGGGKKGPSDGGENDDEDARWLNPAHAFMERLQGIEEKDVEREMWFEEMVRDFR